MKRILLLVAAVLLAGCASIEPGADPLIVNTERAETIAKGSFDLVAQVDNTDRGFWRTNAPAFHNFVEWLRKPETNDDVVLPRGLALIWKADDLKLRYKSGRANSNDLSAAVIELSTASDQAGAWLTIVTNSPGDPPR